MAVNKVSPLGAAVFDSFAGVVVLLGTILRLWLQRNRMTSLPSRIGAACLSVFCVCAVVNYVIGAWFNARQIIVGKEFGKDKVAAIVFDDAYLKTYVAQSFLYVIGFFMLDLTFLAFYYEFFHNLPKSAQWLVKGTTCYTLFALLANILMLFFTCRPFERNWSSGPDNCAPLNTMFGTTFISFTQLVSAIGVFVIPLFIIRRLQLRGPEKSALSFVFACGAMSITAVVVRFGLVLEVINNHITTLDSINGIAIWCCVQVFFGFVANILPTLRALIRSPPLAGEQKRKLLSKTAASWTERTVSIVSNMVVHDDASIKSTARQESPVKRKFAVESEPLDESQIELRRWSQN